MPKNTIELICSKCKINKPTSEFHLRKDSKTRYRSECKICQHKKCSEYYNNNKTKISSRMKKWRVDNKENLDKYQKLYRENNKEQRKMACAKWSLSNKEYLKEYHKKYYKEHRDHKIYVVKKYRENNPDKIKVARYNRRSRIINNGGIVTDKDWVEIKVRYGNKCLCCGKTDIPLDMDHIVPLSLNGKNVKENIQPLCRSCNASKNAKIIDYRP